MGPLPRVICGVPSIACAPSQLRDVRRVPFPHPVISPDKMRTLSTTHIRSTHDDDTEQNMAFPTIQPSVYTDRQGEGRDGCLCMIATSRSRAETMRVQTTNDDVACFFSQHDHEDGVADSDSRHNLWRKVAFTAAVLGCSVLALFAVLYAAGVLPTLRSSPPVQKHSSDAMVVRGETTNGFGAFASERDRQSGPRWLAHGTF